MEFKWRRFSKLLAASARACCQYFGGPIAVLDDCGVSRFGCLSNLFVCGEIKLQPCDNDDPVAMDGFQF